MRRWPVVLLLCLPGLLWLLWLLCCCAALAFCWALGDLACLVPPGKDEGKELALASITIRLKVRSGEEPTKFAGYDHQGLSRLSSVFKGGKT